MINLGQIQRVPATRFLQRYFIFAAQPFPVICSEKQVQANGKIYLRDSTVMNLYLSIFPWATFRKTKEAISLNFGLDADGFLPVFMDMTQGKFHENTWAKALILLRGSHLCIVEFTDPITGMTYRFLTNSFSLKDNVITELFKKRLKLEQFFKGIKQNLRVKTFLGSSPCSVLTQLWIVMCVYQFFTLIKFKAKHFIFLAEMLRLLQFNIFEVCSLADLLKSPERTQPIISPQILLWAKL